MYNLKNSKLSVNIGISSVVHIRPVPVVVATLAVNTSNSSSSDLVQTNIISSLIEGLKGDVNPNNLMVIKACYELCEQISGAFRVTVSLLNVF